MFSIVQRKLLSFDTFYFFLCVISLNLKKSALLSCGDELVIEITLTLSQTTNFRLFQTEEFEEDNFRFNENGKKFSKRVENTVVKEEIAHNRPFLYYIHSVFTRLVLQTRKNQGFFGKGLKSRTSRVICLS